MVSTCGVVSIPGAASVWPVCHQRQISESDDGMIAQPRSADTGRAGATLALPPLLLLLVIYLMTSDFILIFRAL